MVSGLFDFYIAPRNCALGAFFLLLSVTLIGISVLLLTDVL